MIDFAKMRALIREEERLRWAIEKQMARATKSTAALSRTGGGGGPGTGDKVGDGAILLAALKDEHREKSEELEQMRKELKAGMNQLRITKGAVGKTFIRMRYMNGISVRRIASVMNYSEDYIHKSIRATETLIINAQRVQPGEKKRTV